MDVPNYMESNSSGATIEMPIDVQLLIQTLIFVVIVFTGLITSVPVGMTSSNFDGHCILYGGIEWQNATGHFFYAKFGAESKCQFIIYLSVFACILFPLGMGCYYAYATYQSWKVDRNIGSQMWVMPFILVCSLITVMVFISSCVLSVGFVTWCNSFLEGKKLGATINSCADGQDPAKFNFNRYGTNYNSGTYFNFLTVAQTSSWIAFLLWLVSSGFCTVRLIRNRRARSDASYTEPEITTSDTVKIADQEPTA